MTERTSSAEATNGFLGQAGWILYQLAASPYFVIINIFVFASYFQAKVVGDSVQGQVVWGYTQALAGLFIALGAPILGALADAYARSELGIVCGTFAPIGGHDLSEPLQLGAASLYGPHVERQRALDQSLQQLQSAVHVTSAAELPDAVLHLLDHPAERDAMVARYRSLSQAAAIRLQQVATHLLALCQ